ncbi:MAG: hypothetical protein WAT92_00305 [Saprospiraceae bacterium]
MALKTFTRLSDGEKITVDEDYLTASMIKKLGNPEKPEIPTAIKNKSKKDA